MVRFVHTADLQLGMRFSQLPGDRGATLREIRLEVLDRVADLVRSRDCAFVVVAGDCFDANTVDDRVVLQACARFEAIERPVFVVPGRQDPAGSVDSVWQRSVFRANCPDNLRVLVDPAAVDLGEVTILPAPLQGRANTADPTSHWSPDFGRDLGGDKIRIGVAHGSVTDSGRHTPLIDSNRAQRADLDYLALGDSHDLRQVNARTWYAGTPEPTSFAENAPGHVLVVEISERGSQPRVTPVNVARTTWIRRRAELLAAHDVVRIERWYEELSAPLDTLVRLELAGSLSLRAIEHLDRLLDRMARRLLHLRRHGRGVIPMPTADELDTIAVDGYVKRTIERLRADAAGGDRDHGLVAAQALRLLHQLQIEGALT